MGERLSAGLPLGREFFDRDSREVAVDLLGCLVSHAGVTVRLTEVEAYLGSEDPGSHAFRGRTNRNTIMFGPPGHLYVYFTYGMHWCANLVCEGEGTASAILLRAGEVVDGLEAARGRRPSARKDVELGRGPARLANALALTGEQNGLDACRPPVGPDSLQVRTGITVPRDDVRAGPRVGVSGAGGVSEWRYWIAGDPTVSVYRPAVARSDERRGSRRGTSRE